MVGRVRLVVWENIRCCFGRHGSGRRKTVEERMARLGYGDITVWVSAHPERLLAEIEQIAEVESVIQQDIIYAGYEVNGSHSDDEGQLIPHDGTISYRFIDRGGEPVSLTKIAGGDIFVSPAMESMFEVEIGDTIQFHLARTNGRMSFTVAGYFEDAFMGSSMIDRKSFLISSADYEKALQMMADADAIDVLGRSGAMFHISRDPASCRLAASSIARGMVTSTGMLVEVAMPMGLLFGMSLLWILVWAVAVFGQTGKILRIAPMQTLRETGRAKKVQSPFSRKALLMHIALREVLADRKKYISLCLIAMILTVFLSVVGHMGAWLGPEGEGLMNAFSVAEHDLGVQPLNQTAPMDEIERVINWYSPVRQQYELAMQSVTVNGQEYTANVLDDTKWFHMLAGQVCDENSILITDTVAGELHLEIGDVVRVAAEGGTEEYRVSGIYQCANGMGTNIGMSREGYAKIGDITGYIWCRHYIMEDGNMRDYAYDYLEENYRGIDVHTNSWSGLSGIVLVMHMLIGGLYLVTALIVLITVSLVAEKLLQSEKSNMAIYKSLGLHTGSLRISFVLRFLIVVFCGAVLGFAVAGVLSDPLIEAGFQSFGIGEFSAGFSILGNVVPLFAIPLLFMLSAWIYSARLSRVSIVELISENGD